MSNAASNIRINKTNSRLVKIVAESHGLVLFSYVTANDDLSVVRSQRDCSIRTAKRFLAEHKINRAWNGRRIRLTHAERATAETWQPEADRAAVVRSDEWWAQARKNEARRAAA
jgi:hypothetical protein